MKSILSMLKSPWFWVVLVFLGLSIFGYSQYRKARNLEFQIITERQNEQALQDSLLKIADSLQTTAAFVKDLNDKNSSLKQEKDVWKNKYAILSSQYTLAIDSIHILQTGFAELLNDSVISAPFKGKQSIATYDGFCDVNIKNRKYDWDVWIKFDPVETGSEVYYDLTDNLWKTRAYSKSPGIKTIGFSTIDEKTLREIRNIPLDGFDKKVFGVGTIIMKNQFHCGIIVKPSNFMFGINYKIYDNINTVKNELWYDRVSMSAYYFLF